MQISVGHPRRIDATFLHNTQMVSVAVLGASGFAGQETLDRILAHGELELLALGSDSLAGQPSAALDPRLGRNGYAPLPGLVSNDEALGAGADLVFVCGEVDFEAPDGSVVVDLSGHRFDDGWSYALPELAPPAGRLIANPGCYATAALLALAPIAGIVEPTGVVVDGKSGISGAGRTLQERTHAAAVLDNVTPYAVGRHRHAPEIAQVLGFPVTFVPHVVPLRRGLVCTCYVSASEDPRPLLEAAYSGSHVVDVIETVPDLARLQGTDAAEVAAFQDEATRRWIVVCALDNLGKGAAGQAVQNANLALGLEQTTGLRLAGVLV
jgi:N-acetyl-gamma-glutamyl-phosphate reductase